MSTVEIRANKTKALARIMRVCVDLECKQESEALAALREYIAANDAAEAELARVASETGALIGAAITTDEARIAMSQLLEYLRTGRAPRREATKPIRAFVIAGKFVRAGGNR